MCHPSPGHSVEADVLTAPVAVAAAAVSRKGTMETRSVVHDGLRHGAGPVPPGREPPKRQSLASRVAALEARVAELTAEVRHATSSLP